MIINRKKRGFTSPVSIWIKKSSLIQKYLIEKKYYNHDLLNYVYVKKLLEDHISRVRDNSRVLWLVFVFNFWWDKNRKEK